MLGCNYVPCSLIACKSQWKHSDAQLKVPLKAVFCSVFGGRAALRINEQVRLTQVAGGGGSSHTAEMTADKQKETGSYESRQVRDDCWAGVVKLDQRRSKKHGRQPSNRGGILTKISQREKMQIASSWNFVTCQRSNMHLWAVAQ